MLFTWEFNKPIIINIDGEVIPNPKYKDEEGNEYKNKIEPNKHRDKVYIENTLGVLKIESGIMFAKVGNEKKGIITSVSIAGFTIENK